MVPGHHVQSASELSHRSLNQEDSYIKRVYENTGLQDCSHQTEQFIVQGFWMQGEFVCFITVNENNQLFAEVYNFVEGDEGKEIQAIHDPVELGSREGYDVFSIQVNDNREFISVLLYNNTKVNDNEQINGFVLDYRKFSKTKEQSDLVIQPINVDHLTEYIGDRKIFDLKLLFVNREMQSYATDLLVLVELDDEEVHDMTYQVFGVHLPDKQNINEKLFCYKRELVQQLEKRPGTHIMAFLKLDRSLAIIVFDDGQLWHYENEESNGKRSGKINSFDLSIPFKVSQVIFEPWLSTLCLENENAERVFFKYEPDQQNDGAMNWVQFKLDIGPKYQLIKIYDKFVIARYQDGFAFLIELKHDELGNLQIQLGENPIWKYTLDADFRFASYCLQYEPVGRNFNWKNFDLQRYFHITKLGYIEAVCSNTKSSKNSKQQSFLIRVKKVGAEIELKRDLARFEDPFYAFQKVNYPGLPGVTIQYIVPYCIPDKPNLILLVMTPQQFGNRSEAKSQYFVMIDLEVKLKATECVFADGVMFVLNSLYFTSPKQFLGVSKVSSSMNIIRLFGLEHDATKEQWQIIDYSEQIRLPCNRITVIDYDSEAQVLYLLRNMLAPESQESFNIYKVDLKKSFDPTKKKKPPMTGAKDFQLEDVATEIARIKIFPESNPVFDADDEMPTACACYIKSENLIYVLASNSRFSLLFRVDTNRKLKDNMLINFEQIITIKSAMSLHQLNNNQMIACSNTSVVIFKRDSNECEEIIRDYYNPETRTKKSADEQCKWLVGKNIDLKLQLISQINSITIDSCLACINFGVQSVILELDENLISAEEVEKSGYNSLVRNLNDLVQLFKQMLKNQYNLSGYITITEDQGRWDSNNALFPVQLMADDFVTLFQDDDGNQGSDESVLVKHLYLQNYDIWESIIRDAMVNGACEITYDQIWRFLSPTISDHNHNLTFYFCYNQVEKLTEICALPGFEEYYDADKKIFPIFFNFYGETQLTIALKAHDNQSFYRLLKLFIDLQGCIESSYLVSSWFIKAIEEGIEILPLLESPIISTKLSGAIVEHWEDQWPQFHKNVETKSLNYELPFLILLHDESAYDNTFGEEYPAKSDEGEGQVKLQEATPEDMHHTYPIVYYAEKMPVYYENEEDLYDKVFELFEILSETEEMSYFRAGFIQRLIDYMWDSQLVKFYNVVSGMYLLAYFLIISASIGLRWTDEYPYQSATVRTALLTTNIIVLCMSLCTFEMKQIIAEGFSNYIESFWNKNDVMLFLLSTACLIQEIMQLRKYKGTGKMDPRIPADAETWDYRLWYVYDVQEQVMRVTYSLLIFCIHIKILNVLSFYDSVAFLVKIMSELVVVLQTFIAFFLYLIFLFMCCFMSIDVIFNNGDIPHPQGDMIGLGRFGAQFLYSTRFAVGDFDVSTFKNLPTMQKIVAWPVMIIIIVLLNLIYVNINVQVIEGVLGEVNERRMEEAYQKKCGTLCELRGVFGAIAAPKYLNVILTRTWENTSEPDENNFNHTVNAIKKVMAMNKIDCIENVRKLHREQTMKNTEIQIQLGAIEKNLRLGLEIEAKLKNQAEGQPHGETEMAQRTEGQEDLAMML